MKTSSKSLSGSSEGVKLEAQGNAEARKSVTGFALGSTTGYSELEFGDRAKKAVENDPKGL